MPTAPHIDDIRRLVMQTLARLGETEDVELTETILIRDGFYCGRRFEQAGLSAVWFIEEHQLKFHDHRGHVVQVLSLADLVTGSELVAGSEPRRAAA